jgi:hypothetical protein
MWPFLDSPVVHGGVVLYRGPIAPPIEQVLGLAPQALTAARVDPPAGTDGHWAVRLTHAIWGEAVVVSPRETAVPGEDTIRWGTHNLSVEERELAGRAEVALVVLATSPERDVLRSRKALLRWLHLLMALDGLVAVDLTSELFWSPAMLEDELAHDAALDVEALYTIHAVYDDTHEDRAVFWLHTHGLEALGAFDVDVLRPSPWLAEQAADPMRALAFAALEGLVTPNTTRFHLGSPGGVVDFVPVRMFDASAAPTDGEAARSRAAARRTPRRRLRAAGALRLPAAQADPLALPRDRRGRGRFQLHEDRVGVDGRAGPRHARRVQGAHRRVRS